MALDDDLGYTLVGKKPTFKKVVPSLGGKIGKSVGNKIGDAKLIAQVGGSSTTTSKRKSGVSKATNMTASKAPEKDPERSNTRIAEQNKEALENAVGSTALGTEEEIDAYNRALNSMTDRMAANTRLRHSTNARTEDILMMEYGPHDDLSFAAKLGSLSRDAIKSMIGARSTVDGGSDFAGFGRDYRDTGIDLNSVNGIIGLPYMADNVVDPPPIWDASELSGTINSWDMGRCGRDYTKRVLERGQFLVLMPIELRPNLTDTLAYAMSGVTGGLTSKVVSGVVNTIDRVESRLNVASYGFTARIAAKRYWRNVQAHAKAIFFSLGIDHFDSSATKDPNSTYMTRLKTYMPDFIVNNVYANSDMKMVLQNIQTGNDADASELKEYDEAIKRGGSDSGEDIDEIQRRISEVYSSTLDYKDTLTTKSSSKEYSNSLDAVDSDETSGAAKTMYQDSMKELIKYIMNTDPSDGLINKLPFTVFYCNGPIDRNYSWNIDTGVSKLGEHVILGSRKASRGFFRSIFDSTLGKLGALGKESNPDAAAQAAGGANQVADASGGSLEPLSEMVNEWAYHNNGKFGSAMLINNIYIPKTQQGSGSQFGWTVPIRDMALSSDRYSLARLHFTTALLLPYVYPASMPRQTLIIPTSALYCSAFSKGVINAPRAVISNMTLKTDNAFQTTFGVPTELDITLTIEPLYTMSTMPDFNKYWAIKSSPAYFLGAMWNPMSSFNMLATLCGQNTVFSKMPVSLFQFFIGSTMSSIKDTITGVYSSFRASLRDYTASLNMGASAYKLI